MNEPEIQNIFFISDESGMKYMEETLLTYDYYVGLPGLTKKDLEIKEFIGEDSITILVNTKKDTIFVPRKQIRIAEPIRIVNKDDAITATIDRGVLKISIPKSEIAKTYN